LNTVLQAGGEIAAHAVKRKADSGGKTPHARDSGEGKEGHNKAILDQVLCFFCRNEGLY
jgi:hypothetical protein